ncbi:MAG: fumarylacetoacetate hydrolase family protein [Planctomycetaceae bacterium]|nr:fumarylacetoacetate hydrolase family protein [Planctomycetaceae bacterium]
MSLSLESLANAAAVLRRGRGNSPVPIGHLPSASAPTDVDEAMQIQDALNEILTRDGLGRVIGTKIGCTTRVMQEFLGMNHPCSGAIFASTVQHGEGRFDFDSFLHVGVECEIAVRLASPIAAAHGPYSVESVAPLVKSVHAAIEIVDDRYVDFVAREPDWRTWVADNFFGAGIVLGEPVTDWQSLVLPDIRGRMRINGNEVGMGYGRDIINGHPLEALVWLANEQSARGRDLPADWIVMLGSVVQTRWVTKGDAVVAELDGLGSAKAVF